MKIESVAMSIEVHYYNVHEVSSAQIYSMHGMPCESRMTIRISFTVDFK